jgi:hypothetical protein
MTAAEHLAIVIGDAVEKACIQPVGPPRLPSVDALTAMVMKAIPEPNIEDHIAVTLEPDSSNPQAVIAVLNPLTRHGYEVLRKMFPDLPPPVETITIDLIVTPDGEVRSA